MTIVMYNITLYLYIRIDVLCQASRAAHKPLLF